MIMTDGSKENSINMFHKLYGEHSLIPDCCIEFFINEWHANFGRWRNSNHKKLLDLLDYDYVPCPTCLFTRKKAAIRYCETECNKKCYVDYFTKAREIIYDNQTSAVRDASSNELSTDSSPDKTRMPQSSCL